MITAEPPRVLFLCTGNYYRSRFAEIYLEHLARRRRSPWRAESRGLELWDGNPGPLSVHARSGLEARGVPIPSPTRFPLPATREDMERASHVVAVKETEHRHRLETRFPDLVGRVEFWEIHDLDRAEPEDALAALAARVEELLARLDAAPPP